MNTQSYVNTSLWKEAALPKFPSLAEEPAQNLSFDVVVVGGGITGLMTAYQLKEAGQKVCLLERRELASGDTGSTTAHLTQVTDSRLSDLVKGFGEANARLVWDAGRVAIDLLESLVQEHSIACQFERVSGYLHAALADEEPDAKDVEALQKDAALAEKLGIQARFVAAVPIVRKPGIEFPNQAYFHPLRFLAGLAKRIVGDGSAIYEHTEVTRVEGKDPFDVICGKARVRARRIVIASHRTIAPSEPFLPASLFQTKLASYSSYVVGAKIPKGAYPEVSLWDTEDPYYYLRTYRSDQGDYVIFGGEDHKTGQVESEEQSYAKLTSMLRKVMPDAKPEYRWSGQVIESHDGLPFIGETSKNHFVATGFAGNGFTFGTIAALMARDWVLEQKNPWAELFSPSRRTLFSGGIWNYLKENKDYPAYLVSDWIRDREKFDSAVLEKGEGKVVSFHGRKMAAARDEAGKLHTVSAVCTHMGGLVHWNDAERTWDCPCHGSRFAIDGKVLAGPAEKALAVIETDGAEKK